MPIEPLVCLSDVHAGYGRREVLRGVDLNIFPGELVGLLGTNGSGKSTLIRVVAGSLSPTRGEVKLLGRDAVGMTSLERAAARAVVPQTEPAAFGFTVRDMVLMGRHRHAAGRARLSQDDHLAATRAIVSADLLSLAERPVTEVSGGERQRTLLARALAQETPILLLDEPTAHLDLSHQVESMRLVRNRTHRDGSCALAALHDLNLAGDWCDRIVIIDDGAIAADGPPEAVLTTSIISRVFGVKVSAFRHPATGRSSVVFDPGDLDILDSTSALRVHLVCGGGVGAEMMGALVRSGFYLTAGVLNRLDTDAVAAEAMGIETVLEEPFSPIGEVAAVRCRKMIEQADVIVVAPIPFGFGNVRNLVEVREAQSGGSPVVVMGDSQYLGRDFTGGEAAALLERMANDGAIATSTLSETISALNQMSQTVN